MRHRVHERALEWRSQREVQRGVHAVPTLGEDRRPEAGIVLDDAGAVGNEAAVASEHQRRAGIVEDVVDSEQARDEQVRVVGQTALRQDAKAEIIDRFERRIPSFGPVSLGLGSWLM